MKSTEIKTMIKMVQEEMKKKEMVQLKKKNEEEYIAKAITQYKQGIRSRTQRNRLKDHILGSSLNKPKRVAEGLERIYKELLI